MSADTQENTIYDEVLEKGIDTATERFLVFSSDGLKVRSPLYL